MHPLSYLQFFSRVVSGGTSFFAWLENRAWGVAMDDEGDRTPGFSAKGDENRVGSMLD